MTPKSLVLAACTLATSLVHAAPARPEAETQVHDTKVKMTMINGEIVYGAD